MSLRPFALASVRPGSRDEFSLGASCAGVDPPRRGACTDTPDLLRRLRHASGDSAKAPGQPGAGDRPGTRRPQKGQGDNRDRADHRHDAEEHRVVTHRRGLRSRRRGLPPEMGAAYTRAMDPYVTVGAAAACLFSLAVLGVWWVRVRVK
jgi:hypothetical protein